MVPGTRYWVTFHAPEQPSRADLRGSFIDTFLALKLIDNQLYAVFVKQDAIDVRQITGIVEAV